LNIEITKWEKRDHVNHVEYKILVTYQEGLEKVNWAVFKRYSEFLSLQEQLIPYFAEFRGRDPTFVEPKAPPKVKDSNNALSNRKKMLEFYLRSLVKVCGDNLKTFPAPLMDFLFVNVIETTLIDYNFRNMENVIMNEDSTVNIYER